MKAFGRGVLQMKRSEDEMARRTLEVYHNINCLLWQTTFKLLLGWLSTCSCFCASHTCFNNLVLITYGSYFEINIKALIFKKSLLIKSAGIIIDFDTHDRQLIRNRYSLCNLQHIQVPRNNDTHLGSSSLTSSTWISRKYFVAGNHGNMKWWSTYQFSHHVYKSKHIWNIYVYVVS